MFGVDTAASSVVEDVFAHRGDFIERQTHIVSMNTMLNEIYQPQPEMMESLAQVRSEIDLKEAESFLNASWPIRLRKTR